MTEAKVGIVLRDNGRRILLQGQDPDLSNFADDLVRRLKDVNWRTVVADGLGVAASIGGLHSNPRRYFEFSPRAVALLQDHGTIPSNDGFYWSFVQGEGRFAGNLDWRPADLDPTRMLSLQTAVTSLALKGAIRDVQDAIRRVETKVDDIRRRMHSDDVGEVLAARDRLLPVATEARESGSVTKTLFDRAEEYEKSIGKSTFALRDYVQRVAVEFSPASLRNGVRPDDPFWRESLALLAMSEDNELMLWEARLAYVREHRRAEFESVEDAARRAIRELDTRDEALVENLVGQRDQLLKTRSWEGFNPVRRRALVKAGDSLDEDLRWFARQRTMDEPELVHHQRLTARESSEVIWKRTTEMAHDARAAMKNEARIDGSPNRQLPPPLPGAERASAPPPPPPPELRGR